MAPLMAAATILRLQWTLLRRRYGAQRGNWIGLLVALILFVGLAAWYGLGIGLAVLGLERSGQADLAAFLLGIFYAGLVALWAVSPLLTLAAGPDAFVDPEAYQMYPVSRRTLFGLTLLSAAVQPLAWPLYAALIPSTLLLVWTVEEWSRLWVPVASAALGVVWSAAVSSGLIALARTRRMREWLGILGGALLVVAFLLPNLADRFAGAGGSAGLAETLSRIREGSEGAASFAPWLEGLRWTPAGTGARWMLGLDSGPLAAGGFLLWGAVGLGLAYGAFRWSLGRPEATRSRKGARRGSWLTRGLGRAPGSTAALALKEIAYIARDPQLRLAIVIPVILWFFFVASGEFQGPGALLLMVFITLNAITQSGTNLLGRDRAGFETFVTAPIRGRQVLLAKALAHFALFGIQLAALALLAWVFGRVSGSWVALISAAAAAAALLLLAGGQRFSVTAPYPIDPRRRISGPSAGAVLLLLLLDLVVALFIGLMVGAPYFLWGSVAGFAGAAAALALGVIAFRAASDRYGLLLEARREEVRHALITRT